MTYLGVNTESSMVERAALAAYANVAVVGHAKVDGEIAVDGMALDLKTATGCELFAEALQRRGVSKEQATAVKAILSKVVDQSKDEVANLALMWSRAERGETIPSRFVISGHSTGNTIWGGSGEGEIRLDTVRALAEAMPKAAAQIEDIHLSACSTAHNASLQESREEWLGAFPNLKSLWAYEGAAPARGGSHLGEWARATRGRTEHVPLTGAQIRQNVGVWDRATGYHGPAKPLAQLVHEAELADGRLVSYRNGDLAPSIGDTALTEDSRTYRTLSQRSDLSPAERETYRIKAEQTVRLRYYHDGVRREFARAHGSAVAGAFSASGLRATDFGRLSRREAVEQIRKLEQAMASHSGPPSPETTRALELLHGLRDLDERVILARWCVH